MVTQFLFLGLVGLVGVQRLWELRRSAKNELAIRAAGGREHAAEQMPIMRAVHGGWLVAMAVEVFVLHRLFDARVALIAFFFFAVGQALRITAIHALGPRWTVKIMTLPGAPAVNHGIFRVVRHPNYVGVVLEIFALPLIHGAWITSLVFSIANGMLLRARIVAEEHALERDNDYERALGHRPRFVPRLRA